MFFAYLISVWLHLLAAAVWIGGIVFFALVLIPAIRQPAQRDAAASLVHWIGLRFRGIGWLCFALLIATGAFNMVYRGWSWGDLLQGISGRILGLKLLLVAAVLSLSALHDFYIGPRATAKWEEEPSSLEAMALRKQAAWIGRLNLVLTLIVVALGVLLVRGWR